MSSAGESLISIAVMSAQLPGVSNVSHRRGLLQGMYALSQLEGRVKSSCVTTLNRGTEDGADEAAIGFIFAKWSVIREVLGLAPLTMDPDAGRRQRIPSAADCGLHIEDSKLGARDKTTHCVGASNKECVRSK
jgi:hypothetical protein